MTFPRLLPLPALLLLAACSTSLKPAESASRPTHSAKASAGDADADADADTDAPATGARDPQIAALAKAALGCPFDEEAFDTDCPAYKAWLDEETLFADGNGDDTLFSMLGDHDLKVRLLAERKSITSAYWDDKDHAQTVFALAKVEKNERVASDLGNYAAMVDAEKMGLGAALKKLARHAATPVRKALAYNLTAYNESPVTLEAVEILLDDPEKTVAENAVESLSHRSTEPVCKMLKTQMGRSDDVQATALWIASTSTCAGMNQLAATELVEHVADPGKVTREVGDDYARAASGLCRAKSPELKKKGLEIARKLASAGVPDSGTRTSGLGALVDCDPQGGAALLRTLLKDKAVGSYAKIKLELMKPQKHAKK